MFNRQDSDNSGILSDDELKLLTAIDAQQLESQPWRYMLAVVNVLLFLGLIVLIHQMMLATQIQQSQLQQHDSASGLTIYVLEATPELPLEDSLLFCLRQTPLLQHSQGKLFWLAQNSSGSSIGYLTATEVPAMLIIGHEELHQLCTDSFS